MLKITIKAADEATFRKDMTNNEPSSLRKLHWIAAEQRPGPEAWREALLRAIDRIADAHIAGIKSGSFETKP